MSLILEIEEDWADCPKCGERDSMELVNEFYNIEYEIEQGEPVLEQMYLCHNCGFEETYHNGQAVGNNIQKVATKEVNEK